MLNRALIENTLTLHWADRNRDEALRLMTLHEQHSDHLWRDVLASRELPLGSFADLPLSSEQEQADMHTTFGPHGTKSWTGLSTYALHKSIRNTWGDENEQRLLDHVAAVSLRYRTSGYSSAASLVRPQFPDEETILYDAGESARTLPGHSWSRIGRLLTRCDCF